MVATNHTHDPAARSWVAGANRPDADFPIQISLSRCFNAPTSSIVGGAVSQSAIATAALRGRVGHCEIAAQGRITPRLAMSAREIRECSL